MYNRLEEDTKFLKLQVRCAEARDGELLLLREAVNDECNRRRI